MTNVDNIKINIFKRCLHILGLLQNNSANSKWNAQNITNTLWVDKSLFGDYEGSKDFSPNPAAVAKNARTFLKSKGLVSIGQGRSEWEINKIHRTVLEEIAFNHSIYTSEDFHRKRAIASLVKRTPESCLWLFTAIHFARIEKKKIQFNYTRSYSDDQESFIVHPYFIILTNDNFYLYGRPTDTREANYFILSKIKDLEIMNETFNEKIITPDYILKKSISGAFIGKYGLRSPSEKIYNVKIKFDQWILPKIEDMTAALQDLKIVKHDEYYEAFFSIYDNLELCKQLFYFGDAVEIIEPQELRTLMKEMLENSLSMYS